MMLTAGLYAVTVMLVLASIIRAQHKRMRRFQPVLDGLNPAPGEARLEFAPVKKRPDRVASALRTWTAARADADFVAPARPVEPEREPEPKPKLENTDRPEPRTTPAAEPAPARTYSEMPPVPEESPSEPAAAPEDQFRPPTDAPLSKNADYYEVLQISPNADSETIHRVYRIMASRFHPDNPRTGSLERFLLLREAYQTLSDAALRAEYDATRQCQPPEPMPVFWQKSFVDGIEGETNRRLGVLSLLYQRRRICESKPGVSVLELERRMAFPREYLNFTLWYLRSKGFVAVMEDNSDYALTSTGVDYVESSSSRNKVIRELLTAGTGADYTQTESRPKSVVLPFPRTPRGRAEGFRRTQRRKQAGRR
ncbi:MAG: DnaJ domain-containing protein [Bryobacteraceae bacterium]|jgi:curved DNA-binding protein CbpA